MSPANIVAHQAAIAHELFSAELNILGLSFVKLRRKSYWAMSSLGLWSRRLEICRVEEWNFLHSSACITTFIFKSVCTRNIFQTRSLVALMGSLSRTFNPLFTKVVFDVLSRHTDCPRSRLEGMKIFVTGGYGRTCRNSEAVAGTRWGTDSIVVG